MFPAESFNSIAITLGDDNRGIMSCIYESGVTAITLFALMYVSEWMMSHLRRSRSKRVPVETNSSRVVSSSYLTI